MTMLRRAIPPRTAPTKFTRGVSQRLEDNAGVANDEVSDDVSGGSSVWVEGARRGVIKLVTGDVTDSVERDNTANLEVEVDRLSDGIELDEEGLKVDVKADDVETGFSMVAAPSSKRADVVRQHLAFSKSDSQQ